MNRHLLTLIILVAVITAGVQAKTYRWVNEEGVTVYSQYPPPDGKGDVVKPPPPPPTGSEPFPSVQEQLKKLEETRAARQTQEKRKADRTQQEAQRRALCENARRNLQALQGPPRQLNISGSGYERLTEERRQQLIQTTKEQIARFCTEPTTP